MTKEQFIGPFNELKAHFGPTAFSDQRAKLLWGLIEPLSFEWWKATAHKMILSNDGRFDLFGVAQAELTFQRGLRRRQEESEAFNNFSRQMSEAGYEETLNKIGANSLWDAIEKTKNPKESA